MYIFVQVVFMLMKKGWNYKQPADRAAAAGHLRCWCPGPNQRARAEVGGAFRHAASPPRGEIVMPPPPAAGNLELSFWNHAPKPSVARSGFWVKENPNLSRSVPFLKGTQITLVEHWGGDKFSLPSLFSSWLSLTSSLF